MTNVLIRCDASLKIGSGHVMRCRTLARALRARGAQVVFICRRQSGDRIAQLAEEFKVLTLPECHLDAGGGEQSTAPGIRGLYEQWLGCSEEQDACDCLTAIATEKVAQPTWLLVDHYGLSTTWERHMQTSLANESKGEPKVFVIDDLADRRHHAFVLMDANRLDSSPCHAYTDLLQGDCNTLIGPGYALLDPVFPQMQPLVPARTELGRVLVFFGGVDIANHAALALQALSATRLQHLAVDVVLGEASPHHDDVADRARQRPHTYLHVGLPSLAGLMARADLSLGGAGIASWERACLGLPTLVVPVAENQTQSALALQASGAGRCLVIHKLADPVQALQGALLELLDAPEDLRAMSEAGLQIGDGRGLGRVVTVMLGPAAGIHLRPANAADLWLYHWWANDPEVRCQSFNHDPIPLRQHRLWFTERLNSSLAILRVLEDCNGLPLGQIRFERGARCAPHARIGFSLDRVARGRGLATPLLRLGLAELARCWGPAVKAYAEVHAENTASCKAFIRAGFAQSSPRRAGLRCFVQASTPTH